MKKTKIELDENGRWMLPIYYTFDEATGNILIDLYEIEQEAIRRMEKAYPKKKVDSIYVT
jgi:hypothetical protein